MLNGRVTIEPNGVECKPDFGNQEHDDWKDAPPRSKDIKKKIRRCVDDLFAGLRTKSEASFTEVERVVIVSVFALGRLFLEYFLALRQERSSSLIRGYRRRRFTKRRPQSRQLGTFFGKIRYWRTYMRNPRDGGGVYPLDRSLGLTADKFTRPVVSLMTKLATVVSYDRVTGILMEFLLWSPSKTTVEHTVLGLGRFTEDWFEAKPAPKYDGDVLVIQIDSKATPTATEEELRKRRRPREKNQQPKSPRHRGRKKRQRRGPKRRRKKGDKSKNGRATTVVVMYTLKTTTDEKGKTLRIGPINKEVYASYRDRRHAVSVARREADKRGFAVGSGKTVQILTDGDNVLDDLIKDNFPDAIHTLDVFHALEYVWKAGCCFYKERSDELKTWFEDAKRLVYGGKVTKLIRTLKRKLRKTPKKGPGNKGKRKRLESTISYLEKRVEKMNYAWLKRQDLELGTGAVEGAVRYVVGERFDCAGMRWIKERAQALLQLRCIELNGHWDHFMDFAYARILEDEASAEKVPRVLVSRREARAYATQSVPT